MVVSPLPLDLGARVGLVGDAHGSTRFMVEAIWSLAERGATSLVQLGDFGFLWKGRDAEGAALSIVNAALTIADLRLFVVLGNHENYHVLATLPRDEHGCVTIGRVTILPRAGRATAAGRPVGWLSGAASVDRSRRQPGTEWWPAELPTEDEAAPLLEPPGRVDVTFAHDAIDEPTLRAGLGHGWDPRDVEYADAAQATFTRRVATVLPDDGGLVLSGHYHVRHSATATLTRPDGTAVHARSEVLAHEFHGESVGILDMETLDVATWGLDPRRQYRAADEFNELRRVLGLTDRDLGLRLEVDQKTLRRLCAGALPAPDSMLEAMRSWAPE